MIDDLGGGYELGKSVVSVWLNDEFPSELDNAIGIYFNLDKENFIKKYYSEFNSSIDKRGLDTMAKVTTILPQFIKMERLNELLENYFEIFFKRHVTPHVKITQISHISFVGSIAITFQENIKMIANRFGIKIDMIIQYLAENLLKYHLKSYKKTEFTA